MPNANTSILESKLKRLKISFSNENGKIIIGKPKTDYLTLIGLIGFPILTAIGIATFILSSDLSLFDSRQRKFIIMVVGLFSLGIFNITRLKKKTEANRNLKTLSNNEIKITNEFGQFIFNRKNIIEFQYSIEEINEEVYEGNLFLIDDKNKKYQILGFDEDNEKYIEDDLNWFSDFLMKYVKLRK